MARTHRGERATAQSPRSHESTNVIASEGKSRLIDDRHVVHIVTAERGASAPEGAMWPRRALGTSCRIRHQAAGIPGRGVSATPCGSSCPLSPLEDGNPGRARRPDPAALADPKRGQPRPGRGASPVPNRCLVRLVPILDFLVVVQELQVAALAHHCRVGAIESRQVLLLCWCRDSSWSY